jgi:phosphoglycerate dehydrogenase-like enzyme
VRRFRVGVTRDVVGADGTLVYDLSLLDEAAGIEWELLRDYVEELHPDDLAGYDAVIVFKPQVTAASLAGVERLALVARLGVGVDNIDVEACSQHGVLVTITPDGVRRPMASGAIAFLLALAHRLFEMDLHVREGGWDRFRHVGTGLDGATLGLLGVGNVGRDLCALAEPFGLRRIACDPYAGRLDGIELVDLDTLLAESDFLVVSCPLTDETFHLLDAGRLARMKPTAFLVNIARGPIVDQAALSEALRERRLAGAALDVFEEEPIAAGDPLLALDNVILAPHAVGLTDELFRLAGRSVSRSILAVAAGEAPQHLLNREVLERDDVRARLADYPSLSRNAR